MITMRQGRHTLDLMRMAAQGSHIKEATIVLRAADPQQGGKEREYARIKLTDVMISGFQAGTSNGGPAIDSISLNAAKIENQHLPPPSGPVPIPYPMKLFIDLTQPK
jgi:type VI protein secretion system component Hcp